MFLGCMFDLLKLQIVKRRIYLAFFPFVLWLCLEGSFSLPALASSERDGIVALVDVLDTVVAHPWIVLCSSDLHFNVRLWTALPRVKCAIWHRSLFH